MSDQWSGAEDDVSRLRDTLDGSSPNSPSNTGVGSSAASKTGAAGSAPSGTSPIPGAAPGASSQGESGANAPTKMDLAKDAVSGMTEKASGIGSQATSTADAGMAKAASGLDSLASMVRNRGESMNGGQIASLATTAANRMTSGAELLRGKDTGQIMTDLEAMIRRRPTESLLVAAGIGYLISRAK